MDDTQLFWKRPALEETGIEVGLTQQAFETFGEIWNIIPSFDKKRNFKQGDSILSVEGSEAFGCITIPFNINKLSLNPNVIQKPNELTTHDIIFTGYIK